MALDRGEDLLHRGRIVGVGAGEERRDLVRPQIRHHSAALVVPIRPRSRELGKNASLPGVVHVEERTASPIRVHLLQSKAQADDEVPDGRNVVVAVVDGIPDLSGTGDGGDDVVLPQAMDVAGV